jgi:choline dehydrogenase-like flavoprotein
VPRGKVTEGTSVINGQVFLRPIPEDFERWVDWGNDAWSFQQALPYLRKIESDPDFPPPQDRSSSSSNLTIRERLTKCLRGK